MLNIICALTMFLSPVETTREVLASHSSSHPKVIQVYDDMTKQMDGYYGLEQFLKAVEFAAVKHEGQFRKGSDPAPYIIHPIGVAKILWEEGKIRSLNVLTAAILHDTLEDTDTTADEIEVLFGKRVRETVEELTNDPTLTTQENKQRQVDHAPQMSLNAQLVKLADRLYNVRDLKHLPAMAPSYIPWAQKLLKALEGTNPALEKQLQLEIHKFTLVEKF